MPTHPFSPWTTPEDTPQPTSTNNTDATPNPNSDTAATLQRAAEELTAAANQLTQLLQTQIAQTAQPTNLRITVTNGAGDDLPFTTDAANPSLGPDISLLP